MKEDRFEKVVEWKFSESSINLLIYLFAFISGLVFGHNGQWGFSVMIIMIVFTFAYFIHPPERKVYWRKLK